MDFTSIMAAAKNNSVQAKQEKEIVLKTKLSAPKKAEKKKVDVEALKKRLAEEEKRAKEQKMKVKAPLAKPSTNKSKKPAEPPKMIPKNLQKPVYENKEHEAKHKQFMNNMKKISAKAESKSNGPNSSSNKPADKHKKPDIAKKPKVLVMPPSFKEIMQMAEKGAANPGALSRESVGIKTKGFRKSHSSIKVADKTMKDKPNKHRTSNEKSDRQKSSNGSLDKQKSTKHNPDKQKLSNGNVDKHKHSNKPSAPAHRSIKEERKEASGTNTKRDSQSAPTKTASKRPMDVRGDTVGGGPLKKPMLSESARAKLAFKDGRRPPPRPESQNKPIRTGAIVKKEVKKELVISKHANNSKTSQPSSKAMSSKDSGSASKESGTGSGMSAWDRLMGNSSNSNKDDKNKKKHRQIDSEDEEDDLDDFIDDADDDTDYSSAIRDIFGYDKSRYRDEEFDDRSMVAGYADIMKEEVRSAKMGLREDQEDIALEEKTKKEKVLRKKKR